MSDDSKSDSAALKAVTGSEVRDSSMGRRNTGMKLVTVAPLSEVTDSLRHARDASGDTLIGSLVDERYLVEAVLGEGGMGLVYRCRHQIIDKKVAMKVLRADMARDTEVTERFLLEAKAASAIGNEHIIDISDFGRFPDGATYFVMEYLDGQPLSKLLEGETAVPLERLVHVAKQLAEGLQAAHDAGIVHRDLKPDNIYLVPRRGDPDFVKILDFGIAKVSSSAAGKLTRAGSVFGTPHYMSPEQAAGTSVDHRGDMYSFGVILYEMATGTVPFDADHFMAILNHHLNSRPTPPSEHASDVPSWLEGIILRCLSKRPEDRYEDMRAVMAELERLSAASLPPPPPAATPSRAPIYGGVAAVVALALGLAAWAGSSSEEAGPAEVGEVAVAPASSPGSAPSGALPEAEAPAEVVVAEPAVTSQVIVAVEPLAAHVFRGDEDLGTSPVVVEVPEGQILELEVRHDGYVEQTLSVDGSDPKVTVELKAEKRAPARRPASVTASPAPRPKPGPQPKPKIGGGEIVNPWAQ
jgi:eukaryotic-like serine/threonine-protein kinase